MERLYGLFTLILGIIKVGFGVGVDVGVVIILKFAGGITNFFAGVAVGVNINVTEGSGVIVGEISELSVAATAGSKVTVGVKLLFIDSLPFV